jgi:hypothetical protein
VEFQVETRECVQGLDATCDSCELCSFDDPDMAAACELTEKYYHWKDAHCCLTSFATEVLCAQLEVVETKHKLGLMSA